MPLRRPLAVEITLSLALKALALALIGLALFGPDSRPPPGPPHLLAESRP